MFYTERLLHTEAFLHKLSHKEIPTQKNIYTEEFLRIETFTHKNLYT